jgi:Domain of unknown function (DUF4129)
VGTPPDQPPSGPLSAGRTAALAGALVALLAVVSVAARSDDRDRAVPGGALADSAGHHAFVWFLLVVFPILAVIGIVLFLYAQVVRRRDPQLIALRKRARRRFLALVAVVVAIVVYSAWTGHNPLGSLHLRNPFASASPHGPKASHPVKPGHSGGFATVDWAIAGLTWLLIAGAAAVALRRMRRRPDPAALVPIERDDEPADTRLERLRAETDPRRAVIGAYALMDHLMAERSLARRRSEAPLEYLGRMTAAGYVRITALGRLTRLYARARFSTHPVDTGMQVEAVDAVEAIAGEDRE